MTLTARDLLDRLHVRYAPPQWLLVEEVSNTRGRPERRADAIACANWASDGYRVLGFEVKVDRRDWLRELDQVGKARPFMERTNEWWVVAPANVVQIPELPTGWGLLRTAGKRLRIERRADERPTEPLLGFYLAIVAAAMRGVEQRMQRTRREGYEAGWEAAEKSIPRQENRKVHAELMARIDEFERASGVSISHWSGPAAVGSAVGFVLDLRARSQSIERVRTAAVELLDALAVLRDPATEIADDG